MDAHGAHRPGLGRLIAEATSRPLLFAGATRIRCLSPSTSTTAPADLLTAARSTGFRIGTWHVDDLASNLGLAGLIIAVLAAIGAVGTVLGRPWGAGMIGGSGLSAAGVAEVPGCSRDDVVHTQTLPKFPFLDCSKSSIFGIRKILHFTFYVKFTT